MVNFSLLTNILIFTHRFIPFQEPEHRCSASASDSPVLISRNPAEYRFDSYLVLI